MEDTQSTSLNETGESESEGVIASVSGNIVGECTVCEQQPWDTYDGKYTCEKCCALVLVCKACRGSHEHPTRKRSLRSTCLLCERCKKKAS